MTNSSIVLVGAWLALLLTGCTQEPIQPLGDWALTHTAQNHTVIFPSRFPAAPSGSAVPEPADAGRTAITVAPVRATPVTSARATALVLTLTPASIATSVATSTRSPSLAPTVPAAPRPPTVTPTNTPSATPTVAILPPGQAWGVVVAFSGNADARRAALDALRAAPR